MPDEPIIIVFVNDYSLVMITDLLEQIFTFMLQINKQENIFIFSESCQQIITVFCEVGLTEYQPLLRYFIQRTAFLVIIWFR